MTTRSSGTGPGVANIPSGRRALQQRGFTLMEMITAVAVLTLVLGVVFSQITAVQKSYKSEEGKLDVVQQTREFLDEFARNLHQAGYPNSHNYNTGLYDNTSQNIAVGIVKVSPTTVWFEGDVDGNGQVESVQYSVVTGANGACPCSVTRSMIHKVNGTAPLSQNMAPNASVALRGVMNSTPFTALDANGNTVAATDITQTDGSGNPATYKIRSIKVVLNVQTRTPDLSGVSPVLNMSSTARVNTPLF